MTHEDIEATKAPLMEHLIELRSRLIKALIAFGIAFVVCFFFAKTIYNVLTWPFVWVAGPENSKFIYTGAARIFRRAAQACDVRRGVHRRSRSSRRRSTCSSRPASIAHERQAFLPYLVATPIFFAARRAGRLFPGLPMLARFSLGMQQPGGRRAGRDRAAAEGRANIST